MEAGPTDNTVTLVIPLFNEEEVLPSLIDEIQSFRARRPEITDVILIDDGSTDATARQARDLTDGLPGFMLVRFSRNFGHQLAVTAGLHMVRTDAAVILDADLQDPLEVVGRMIDKWREGYDVVYGVRRVRGGVTLLERLTARLYYRFFKRFTDVDAPLDAGDFRLVSRSVMDAYAKLNEQQPYVRGLVSWLGFNQVGIEYDRQSRAAGRSKYPWRRRMQLALDGIASFSGKPLRYAVRIGIAVSALSAVGLIWVVLVKYAFGTAITGWSSLIFVAFFFGGLQLFFLGVVGSYVARVYDEVKGRPRYIIRDTWRSGRRGDHRSAETGSGSEKLRG